MRSTLLFAALLLSAAVCFAADRAAPAPLADKAKTPVTLFDGKTLDGWKVIGKCEIVVEDGCIFMKSGNGVVRPDRKFKDYVLELDWKALKADNWDSGIYIRCIDPAGNYPWPKVWQVNLKKGQEGEIEELKAARTPKGLCKDKEWNHFKLTVAGTTAELEVNGKPAWKTDGLTVPEGFISLQSEVPGGGQFLFKNITVLELEGK